MLTMASRGRGKFRSLSDGPRHSYTAKVDTEDPVVVYMRICSKFPDKPVPDSIQEWVKDIFAFALMNPQNAIDVSKYIYLFTNMKGNDVSTGLDVKKAFLKELELAYNDYIKSGNDPVKYRNFTYFFATALYFIREPGSPPLKDVMSALLILISKLDIMDSVEDSIVYSKSLVWLSKFITNVMDGSVVSNAYKEALNRLRELLASGKGSLACLACLEASVNGGLLNETARDFYDKSLSKTDFSAVESNLSIVIPVQDKNKFLLNDIKNVIFV